MGGFDSEYPEGGIVNSLLRKVSQVGFISVVDRVFGVVLGIFTARLLGLEGYGVYAFAMAIVPLLLIPLKAGQPSLLMRDAAARNLELDSAPLKEKFLIADLIISMTAISILTALVFIYLTFHAATNSLANQGAAFLIAVCMAYSESRAHVLRGIDRAFIAQLLVTLLPSVIIVCFVLLLFVSGGNDPFFVLGSRLVACLFALCLLQVVLSRAFKAHEEPIHITRIKLISQFQQGLPFMLLGGIVILMSRVDIVMLGLLKGSLAVGYYNAALQGAMLIFMITAAANTIVAPAFSKLHAEGDSVALQQYVTASSRLVFCAAMPLILFLFVAGDWLLSYLFGQGFEQGGLILKILVVGYGVSLLFGETGFLLNMTGHENITLKIYAFFALLNIMLNFIFIFKYGPVGAAVATSLVLIFQRIVSWFVIRSELNIVSGVFLTRK